MSRSRELSGWLWEISTPPGFEPSSVQPVAYQYTDWVIAALRVVETVSNLQYLWKGRIFLGGNSKSVTKRLIYSPLFEGVLFQSTSCSSQGGVFVCGLTVRYPGIYGVSLAVCAEELKGQMLNRARQQRNCEQHEFQAEHREPVLLSYCIYHSY